MIMWYRNTPIYYYTKKIPYTPITWNMETFSLDDKFDFCFVDYKVARPGEKVIVNNDIYVVSNYIYDTNNGIIEVLLDIPKFKRNDTISSLAKQMIFKVAMEVQYKAKKTI